MQTPVNLTTDARSASNDFISCGNIGASANGPRPWLNDTAVDMQMALIFQNLFQFCGRQRSSYKFMRLGPYTKGS